MWFYIIGLTLFFQERCHAFHVQKDLRLQRRNSRRYRDSLSLRLVKDTTNAIDTIMYFNREFKAGLKFILLPQEKLKENAKAAAAQEALINNQDIVPNNGEIEYGPIDPTYLSRVEINSWGNIPLPEKNEGALEFLQSIPDSLPKVNPPPSVRSFFSESLSIPDITILKETLSKALPEKSPIEISEMTRSLVQITASVQERTQQLIDSAAIATIAKDMPDLSGIFSEQYQQLMPVISEAAKGTKRVLNDNLLIVQGSGQEISNKIGESYQHNQQLAGESYQQASRLAGESIQQASKYTDDSIQQASKYASEGILQLATVSREGFQQVQQFTTEESNYLSRVANDNYRQVQPYIDEAKNDFTRRLNEQYDIVQPYMQQAVKDLSDVLDEKYHQAIPLLQDIVDLSYERGVKYQKAMLDILAVDSEPSQILADLKERIISNAAEYKLQYRVDHLPDINYVPTVPYDKLDAVFDSLTLLVQTDGWTLGDLIQNVNLEELGGFYGGCIVGCFLVASLLVKSKTPPMVFTAKPMRQQSVGQGIQTAIEMEEKMQLERLVSDLTLAVTALSKELRDLKQEKAKTEYALATMKSDVRMLQNAIQATDLTERQLKKQTVESAFKETELHSHLRDAEMKVHALQTEKELLQLEINGLSIVSDQLYEPKPPTTLPAPVTTKSDSGVWFANIVSKVTG